MSNSNASHEDLDTIQKRIKYIAEKVPNRELFVFYNGDKRTSFTSLQLFQLAGKFANRLRHVYGFQRGDVIANTLPNSPERVVTDLGIHLAGCVTLNGQVLLADGEDFFQNARNSQCVAVVLRPEDASSAWRLLKAYVSGNKNPDTSDLSCETAPQLTLAIHASRLSNRSKNPFIEDLREDDVEVFVDTSPSKDEIAHVFTTSGSTGYSKLIARTHAELLNAVALFGGTHILDTDTSTYCDRNLGWAGGYPYNTYRQGEKRVMQDWYDGKGKKSGENVWNAISKEKCDVANVRMIDVDNILRYLNTVGGSTTYKCKFIMVGGQPITKQQIRSSLKLSEKVTVGYGSTEAIVLAFGTLENADYDDFYCGKPVAGVEIKIVNDKGEECKPYETGTIFAKGGQIFKGYLNRLQDPDPNTAKVFTKDGWFDTEDLGHKDEDGNLYVMGRNKDTITFGCTVFYPGWMEVKILQHPDIAEAFILPVSDSVLYHEICCCVRPIPEHDLTVEKLKQFCQELFITDLANEYTPMPKYFMILDSFPETDSGKPDKQKLIRMAEERFGAGRTTNK